MINLSQVTHYKIFSFNKLTIKITIKILFFSKKITFLIQNICTHLISHKISYNGSKSLFSKNSFNIPKVFFEQSAF